MSAYYGTSRNTHPHGGTPDDFMVKIIDEFGPCFDPCPNGFKVDGLSIDWPLNQTAFVNPPYTRGEIAKWVAKCHEQWLRGVEIVLLIPPYCDTKYFHKYIYNQASLRFIEGRLKFKGYPRTSSASFPSMLCIFEVKE